MESTCMQDHALNARCTVEKQATGDQLLWLQLASSPIAWQKGPSFLRPSTIFQS